MSRATPRIAICGAGIAGLTKAALALHHKVPLWSQTPIRSLEFGLMIFNVFEHVNVYNGIEGLFRR